MTFLPMGFGLVLLQALTLTWLYLVIKGLKTMKTFICKIPPNLPLPKGGAAVQSRITHFKPGIGTLAPDGITPLWPPAHRASLRGMSPSGAEPDPEGKEGPACLLPVCRSLGAGRKPRRRQGEIF